MEETKLIIQVMALRPTVIFDDQSLYMTGGGSGPFYGIRPSTSDVSLHYLIGILNSKLFGFIAAAQSTQMRGGYLKYSKQYIESAPIRTIDFTDPADVARHDHVVRLVEQMLALHKARPSARTLHAQSVLAAQIAATDRPLDRLVDALYGLSEGEIGTGESH